MSHDFKFDPLHAAVPQGGFSKEKGGNLRDHNGCVQGPGTASTTHYDGDYGSTPPIMTPPVMAGGAGSDSAVGGGGLSGSDSIRSSPPVGPTSTAPAMPRKLETLGIGKGPRR